MRNALQGKKCVCLYLGGLGCLYYSLAIQVVSSKDTGFAVIQMIKKACCLCHALRNTKSSYTNM